MEIRKLTEHRYAQCGVYSDVYLKPRVGWCQEYGFISYKTKVIIHRGARIIFTGYYSRTTSKQMGWYLKEFGFRPLSWGLSFNSVPAKPQPVCSRKRIRGGDEGIASSGTLLRR